MIFNMEFKSNFGKTIAWAIVLIVLLGLLMAFYPFLAEPQMNSLFGSMLNAFNDSTKEILGFTKSTDITNIGDYLSVVYHYLAVLIFIFAMQLGANSLSKEQNTGNIEYIYSNPISKSEIVTAKLSANIVLYLIFLAIMAIATYGFVFIIAASGVNSKFIPDITDFEVFQALIKIFVSLLGSGLVFMSFGFLLSAMSKTSEHQDAISALFVFLIVLVTIIGKTIGSTFANIVSFFPNVAFATYSFINSDINIVAVGVNIALFVLFVVFTYTIYSHKELKY
ncbi:ABC-2 type transport system permease protein [Peptoniphilus olsenii]|uniref:ABC-2 type transport system permease protein n=1 Tax=Peptoniphilus olsenii TaxID=411570 RepID=A0ABV2J8U6_9FIRM